MNMSITLSNLIRLQKLTLGSDGEGSEAVLRKQVERARAKLPEAMLRRFDHLVEYGRVPLMRLSESGACGSCHLKLPAAEAMQIRQEADHPHTCPHCGCWLYTAAEAATEKSLAPV